MPKGIPNKFRPYNLARLRASSFADATRDELETSLMLLTGENIDGFSNEQIVTRLLTHLADPADSTHAPLESSQEPLREPTIPMLGKIPNLSPVGRWEGRMRRVMMPLPQANSKQEVIPIGWDAHPSWKIKMGDTVDMPWPYWVSLQSLELRDDLSDNVRKWGKDEDGNLEVTIKPKVKKMYGYQDLGDVPGTEDLPEDYFHYFRDQAFKNNVFDGQSRAALQMIYRKLRDNTPSTFFEKKENIDIRVAIATILHPDLLDKMNVEIYDAA